MTFMTLAKGGHPLGLELLFLPAFQCNTAAFDIVLALMLPRELPWLAA